MTEAPLGTSAESASKIMGRACITIEEVLGLFPEAKSWVDPSEYQRVPFSARTLYHLAERKWEYILFPAFPCYPPNGFLSVQMIERVFQKIFPEILVSTIQTEPIVNVWSDAPAVAGHEKLYRISPHALNLEMRSDLPPNYKQLYRVAAYALNNHYAPQKWYLLSGRVLNFSSSPVHRRMGKIPFKIERSLIYIYAWLLYWRLRNRQLFVGKPFSCSDYYAPAKNSAEIILRFGDTEIMIGQKDGRIKSRLGIVRSLLCFDSKKASE